VTVIVTTIKGKISVVTRESLRADHAVSETRMTRTVNESSPSIYTLGGGQEKQVKTKRREEKRKKKSTVKLPIEYKK